MAPQPVALVLMAKRPIPPVNLMAPLGVRIVLLCALSVPLDCPAFAQLAWPVLFCSVLRASVLPAPRRTLILRQLHASPAHSRSAPLVCRDSRLFALLANLGLLSWAGRASSMLGTTGAISARLAMWHSAHRMRFVAIRIIVIVRLGTVRQVSLTASTHSVRSVLRAPTTAVIP